MDQKQIAQTLDRRAGNAVNIGASPASRKQIWYLAGLLVPEVERHGEQSVEPLHNTNFVLSSRAASHWIDILVGSPA